MNYVYYFLNYDDEIIYVGRTNDIKRRMKEHFVKGHLDKSCYEEVNKIMFAKVNDSKYDTEICETLLINKYKPKYNKEKVFFENNKKTSYSLIDLNFKELTVYFLDNSFNLSLNDFKYPCYLSDLSNQDRCKNLIDYNLGNLKHRKGIYKNLNKDIYKENRYIYSTLIKIYEYIGKNICYEKSNIDEPINDNGELSLSYVTFNIDILNKLKLDIKTIALIIQCGFIFHITDSLYAVPIHTENVIKTFNKNFLN